MTGLIRGHERGDSISAIFYVRYMDSFGSILPAPAPMLGGRRRPLKSKDKFSVTWNLRFYLTVLVNSTHIWIPELTLEIYDLTVLLQMR